jgi:WD40 repeat protein/S1-C subfamily serine protease
MSCNRNRLSLDHGLTASRRRAGLAAVITVATLAGLLMVPGGRGLAQDAKAQGAQEAKLGLGDLIKRANQGVVLINIENRSGQKVAFGSGFLIDDKGLVATNFHVVAQAAKARVVFEFKDGNTAGVKCMRAYDKKRDLAILELDKTPPAARSLSLGEKAFPAPGDTVTAIGHPQGLNFTATNGIVSAIRKASDRSPVKPEDDQVWVQSTAFIGGGSSGGPLLSETGRVIGINTSVVPGQGISFAVHVGHLVDLLATLKGAKPQPLPGSEGSELYNPLADLQPRVNGMYEEYSNAVNEFTRQLRGATNQFQIALIRKTQNPGPKYAKRFFQIAEGNRRSTTGFQALYLACVADDPAAPGSVFKPAIDRILEDHAKERWVHHAFQGLAGEDHQSVPAFFRETLKRNSHPTVQAAACYYLATWLRQKPNFDGAEVLSLLKRCTGEFKEVQLEFDVDDRRVEYSVAELAKPMVFALEHLCVGKKAPEIVGSDVDGKTFKLSDYAGKVVVVDFFADWCPYCVRMYPEERALTEKLAGKPFAMLGVNCDSQDTLRQILSDKRVTWRCWSDGKNGPITQIWQLEGYPLMFVIDHQGVIRQKFEGQTSPGQLQETVTELMKSVPGYQPPTTEVAKLSGHATGETVEFAAISPDGGRVLSGSADKMVILWDRKTGRVIRRFGPAGGRVISALFSPDGRCALTAGEDRVIRLWDLQTGKLLREFKGHDEWVFSLAFSPDGRLAYSTSGGPDIWRDGKDSSVRIWDVETGREVRKLEGHKGRVLSVAVSPDGRSVLTGGDTRVILWDASDGKIIRRFDGHTGLLSRVSFLPDGKRVVSSSYDKTIRLWDLQTGKEIHRFVGHPKEVTWFAVSPDGRRLLSSDYNAHELRLWDLNTHEQIDRVDLGTISPTRGSFSADSRYAVWPGTGGFLGLYEFLTSEPAQPLARSTQPFDARAPGAEPAGAPR